jgi:hypothetical protein
MFLYAHGIQFYILCNVPMILMNRIFCSWSIWNGHFTFFFFLTRGLLPPHIPFVSLNELPIKIGIPLFSIVIVQSILFCRQLKQLFIHYYNINTCTTKSDSNHNNTQLRQRSTLSACAGLYPILCSCPVSSTGPFPVVRAYCVGLCMV